jgi:hypothetical protein
MLRGYWNAAMGSSLIADPQTNLNAGSPPLASDDSIAIYTSERRRIVAQVRREVPKKCGFFAAQKFAARCDDLLTMTVDNDDWAGL